MMVAAADYAEQQGQPPPVLSLALDCEHYHALPRAGGVLDQPAGLLRKMSAAANVYRAFVEYHNQGRKPGMAAKWRSENKQVWEIVSEVNRVRENG